jgi:hypothetical protein
MAVQGLSRRAGVWAVSLAVVVAVGMAGSAGAAITFSAGPGTGAPTATLGGLPVVPFPLDPRPFGESGFNVTSVPTPAGGSVGFNDVVNHDRIGSGWASWSHGYTGDVYDSFLLGDQTTRTLTLPVGTKAFYSYVEPTGGTFDVTAIAQDGTSSGPVSVVASSGAKYLGFSATGSDTINSIVVTFAASASGFGVGEFGINISPPVQSGSLCAQIQASVSQTPAALFCYELGQFNKALAAGQPAGAHAILGLIDSQIRSYRLIRTIPAATANTLLARVAVLNLSF